MSNPSLMHPLLIPEILEQVFFFLSTSVDQTYDENIRDLFSCALVCRQWCRNAVPIMWEKPFETCYRKCTKVVSSLVLFLENINSNITKQKGRQKRQQQNEYIIHEYLNSEYQQGHVRMISAHTSNSSPLFNYPSFVKHLNYDRLYSAIERWCEMERYIPDTMEVYVMRALLRLMADSGGVLTTLKIHPQQSNEFRYCLIHEPEICGLFKKVKYLTHEGCCYVDYTMALSLAKICKDVVCSPLFFEKKKYFILEHVMMMRI